MGKTITRSISLVLIISVVLSLTSCVEKSGKEGRKVSADTPWFSSSVYDIEVATDPAREIEDCMFFFLGADEKYYVVRTYGQYTGSMEAKAADLDSYSYDLVTVIDRNSKQVVNTIDLNNEHAIDVLYANGYVTTYSYTSEKYYDPLTSEVKETRAVNRDDIGSYYHLGEYLVEAIDDFSNGEGSYKIKISSPEGNTIESSLKQLGTSIQIEGMFPIDNDNALIYADTSKGRGYYELDLDSGKIQDADAKNYEWIDLDKIGSTIVSSAGDLYSRTPTGITRIDTSAKKVEDVFDYNCCGISRAKLEWYEPADCSDGALSFIGQKESFMNLSGEKKNTFQIVELTKEAKNPNAGKTVLELYAPYISDEIGAAIETYNANNKKFYIEVVDRYDKSKYETDNNVDWRTRTANEVRMESLDIDTKLSTDLAMDIISGKGPDILIGTSRYNQLNNPDYLTDLTPYVGKLDPGKYFTNVIEGSKSNGKLYQLPVSFYIRGIYTDKGNAGSSGVGFTLDEYKDFVSGKLNGNDVIKYGQALYFVNLFNSMNDKFIKDGKVDFTCPEFAEIAEYVKENVPEKGVPSEDGQDTNSAENVQIQSYLDFYYRKQYSNRNIDPAILGYPSSDGRGPLFLSYSSVAVSAQATDVKACGEFVKFLLSDEIQAGFAVSSTGFAVNRNAFKTAGESAVRYCNERDNPFETSKVMFTTDDINNLEATLLSCSRMNNEDSAISIILFEEMPAYFLGQKDLDAVIKITADRAQKVLDERG
jgi:ABC-type glycerol-3-phosphate transport system substrate-binding protein